MYQQTRLSDTSAISAPGLLPDVIATWGDPDILADLTGRVDPQFGLDGTGFWPVDVTEPSYDPSSQVLMQPTACDKADPKAKRWSATATVRAMTVEEYAAAHTVPSVISDRQFYQQLAVLGMITEAEAIAAVGTGAIPSEMRAALNSLPASIQFGATMKLTGATTFERDDALVAVFAAAQTPPMTSDQLDALWRAASAL